MEECLIACESFKTHEQEIRRIKPDAEIVYLSLKYHEKPEGLRDKIQELIDRSGDKKIYLLYGKCAGHAPGLQAGPGGLHLMPQCDCVEILSKNRGPENRKGVYFVIPGLSRSEGCPSRELEKYTERFGIKRGLEAFRRLYGSFEKVVVLGEDQAALLEGGKIARALNIPMEIESADISNLVSFLNDEEPFKKGIFTEGEKVPYTFLL